MRIALTEPTPLLSRILSFVGARIAWLGLWIECEGDRETMDLVSDPEFMAGLEESKRDIAEGRGVPWEELKRRGLD